MTNDKKERDLALDRYICSRQEKEKRQNIFLEPVGDSKTSRCDLTFNIVTALLNNGFKPDDEVKRWYAEELRTRNKS